MSRVKSQHSSTIRYRCSSGGACDFSCGHGNLVDLDIVELHDKSALSVKKSVEMMERHGCAQLELLTELQTFGLPGHNGDAVGFIEAVGELKRKYPCASPSVEAEANCFSCSQA